MKLFGFFRSSAGFCVRPAAIAPRRGRAAAIAAAALMLAGCAELGGSAAPATSPAAIALIQRTMDEVERSYVEPVKPDQMVTGALKGMLTRLDPHSDYMDQREFHDLMATTSGQFGGVGIEISVDDGVPQVLAAIEGTPAAAAGVHPGDRIVRADGTALVGMDIEEVVRRLRGTPGTTVVITIARTGRPPFEIRITRAIIKVESVKAALKPDKIGYVRISTFDENTAAALRSAIGGLHRQAGGNLNGFILDLRNDAGGLLDAAVEAAADFLDSGTVVSTRGRDPDENRVYEAAPNGDLVRGTPMVVLINGASASASEIVAGALQDNRRATLMGSRSFGKGSVQSIIPIDGHGALRLTTALYYTPSGRSIQGQGVMPEVAVALPKEQQVANALVTYESDLYGSLKPTGALAPTNAPANKSQRRHGEPKAVPAGGDHPIIPSIIGTAQDTQLNAALNYLKSHRRAAR